MSLAEHAEQVWRKASAEQAEREEARRLAREREDAEHDDAVFHTVTAWLAERWDIAVGDLREQVTLVRRAGFTKDPTGGTDHGFAQAVLALEVPEYPSLMLGITAALATGHAGYRLGTVAVATRVDHPTGPSFGTRVSSLADLGRVVEEHKRRWSITGGS